MKRIIKSQKGVLTVEACLCLTLFMFLILFLYSFFAIFEAQMKIHHTLLQSAQSMSLDSVATEKLKGDYSSVFNIAQVIGFNAKNVNPEFVSPTEWSKEGNEEIIPAIAEERFIAYLTSGDREEANDMLERYRITDGLSGLDFTKCKIDDDGNISLSVTYSIEYIFDYKAFNMEPLKITSTANSRKWK